jgi:AcrR family transcriptional regulator
MIVRPKVAISERSVNIATTPMADHTRPYRMQRRAESQQRTRLRITESAFELHSTLGPSRVSISAVAAHAGVRRSTLYRHFADEAALFDACTAHWYAGHPLPSISAWASIDDPDERLRVAVAELYAYYASVSSLLGNLYRDELTVPLVQERFAAFRSYVDAARDTLVAGRPARGARLRRTRAAIAHTIAYSTWKSLVQEQGLTARDAGALVRALVDAA